MGELSFRLESAVKGYTVAQDKVIAPTATVENALARLREIDELKPIKINRRACSVDGAFNCCSCANCATQYFAKCVEGEGLPFSSYQDVYQASGKGLTLEQAQASAIMEFTERYSWLNFDYARSPGYCMESYATIKAGPIRTVEPDYFLANYVNPERHAALLAELLTIPLRWVRGVSLTHGGEFYYPVNWHSTNLGSNGLAAGNVKEEAIIQALCEVIERENVYRLFVEQRPPRTLDLASVRHPLLRGVIDKTREQGIELTVQDITYDLGVPTFIVLGVSEADRGLITHRGVGQGSHPNPDKALMRALSEYFETYTQKKKDQRHAQLDYEMILGMLPKIHTGWAPLMNPHMLEKTANTVSIADVPDMSASDIKVEIDCVVERLASFGHEVIVVDKTHPTIGIPVVRVVVPRMRANLGCDVMSPYGVMTEVCHEAQNPEAARRYLIQAAEHDSILQALRENPLTASVASMVTLFLPGFSPSLYFGNDYLDSHKKTALLRKKGPLMLKGLAPLFDMTGGAQT